MREAKTVVPSGFKISTSGKILPNMPNGFLTIDAGFNLDCSDVLGGIRRCPGKWETEEDEIKEQQWESRADGETVRLCRSEPHLLTWRWRKDNLSRGIQVESKAGMEKTANRILKLSSINTDTFVCVQWDRLEFLTSRIVRQAGIQTVATWGNLYSSRNGVAGTNWDTHFYLHF